MGISKKYKTLEEMMADLENNPYSKWSKKHPKLANLLAIFWWRLPDYPRDLWSFVIKCYQRAKRGWSYQDTWLFDYYLSDVIAGSVNHLKENSYGYSSKAKNMRQWRAILKKICYTFEVAKKIINNDTFYQESKNFSKSKYIKYTKLFKKKAMTLRECRKYEEGWKLFQEYYFDLWD